EGRGSLTRCGQLVVHSQGEGDPCLHCGIFLLPSKRPRQGLEAPHKAWGEAKFDPVMARPYRFCARIGHPPAPVSLSARCSGDRTQHSEASHILGLVILLRKPPWSLK